jgi:hypothetical protein
MSENGFCVGSSTPDGLGTTASAGECWSACKEKHGDPLVAINWWPSYEGQCWCQKECLCMANEEGTLDGVTIMRSTAVMPAQCVNYGMCACGIYVAHAYVYPFIT